MYLLERGVRLTGTDAWSWDAPFVHTAEKYKETEGREPDLGRPQGRARHRLLPPGEAAQPRSAARRRLRRFLLPAQDPRRLGGLDARGGDLRRPAAGELPPRARLAPRCHGPARGAPCAARSAAGAALLRVADGRGRQLRIPQPIRIIVPFAQVAPTATRASTAISVSSTWRQPVPAQTAPGGSGVIAPGGQDRTGRRLYATVGTNSPITVSPIVMKDLPYEPLKDFRGIIFFGLGRQWPRRQRELATQRLADLIQATRKSGSPLPSGTYSAGYELVAAWLGTATGIARHQRPVPGHVADSSPTSSATRCRSAPSISAASFRS